MSIKIKKKTFKIIIIAILIIAIAVFGVIVSRVIINENQIKQTDEKLSKIDVKELEQSLIEELKNTSLNVNTSSFKTFFGTEEDFFNESNENKALGFSVSLHYKEGNPFKDYVSAYIMPNNNSGRGMVIPCFKIVCDNNNNFKYILYQSDSKYIREAVIKVLETKYNIDTYNVENDKYNEKFIVNGNKKYQETMEIYINLYNDDVISIAREIEPKLKNANENQILRNISDNKKVSMSFFGIVDNSDSIKNSVTTNNDNSNISKNDTNTTNNIENNATMNSSTQDTFKSSIKNGTYFKKLTATEKEEGIVSLGDIKIVIKNKNIEFYDNSSQIALQGTYTIENNKIVGTYITANYYSYDKLENVTETIEDRFEFEIKENNTLYDTIGYGQFLGKCLQRNATYEIVE